MTLSFILLMLSVTSPFLLMFTVFMPMEEKQEHTFQKFEKPSFGNFQIQSPSYRNLGLPINTLRNFRK